MERKMKNTKTLRNAGFTLVEIMIVVAIIGLLAAIAIPNFVKARATSQMNACINNLRQIDAAANEFALEKGQKTGDAINMNTDLTPYIKLNTAGAIAPCLTSTTFCRNNTGFDSKARSERLRAFLLFLNPGKLILKKASCFSLGFWHWYC